MLNTVAAIKTIPFKIISQNPTIPAPIRYTVANDEVNQQQKELL